MASRRPPFRPVPVDLPLIHQRAIREQVSDLLWRCHIKLIITLSQLKHASPASRADSTPALRHRQIPYPDEVLGHRDISAPYEVPRRDTAFPRGDGSHRPSPSTAALSVSSGDDDSVSDLGEYIRPSDTRALGSCCAELDRSLAVPAVEEEDEDDGTSEASNKTRPTRMPFVDPLIVEFICTRFPERVAKARHLTATPPPYGVAYRDVLRLRAIGGALADLGIGTGKTDTHFLTVEVGGEEVRIYPDDVMVTLGMRPSTYRSVRSRLEKVQSVYTWLGQNKDLWEEDRPRRSVRSLEHRAYYAMNALFGPTPLPTRRHIPLEPLPAGIHDALWEPCSTFLKWADDIMEQYGLTRGDDLPVSPEFYDASD